MIDEHLAHFCGENTNHNHGDSDTEEFIQKVIALRETEMDFAIEPFNVEELAAVEISPKDYAAISWLIDE